jgi:anti-sigma B factor antagonist
MSHPLRKPAADSTPNNLLLSTTVSRHLDYDTIAVFGELDENTAALVRQAIDTALARKPRRLVIDLTQTRFMGSCGLSLLIDTRVRAHATGSAFYLRYANRGIVATVLRLSGLSEVFEQFSPPVTLPASLRPPPDGQ